MEIRRERLEDKEAIAALIGTAFASAEHSDGTEAQIVDRLRSLTDRRTPQMAESAVRGADGTA